MTAQPRPEVPTFATAEQERQYRKEHLAAAFRVFGRMGFSEGTAGHITARDPELLDHFWVNPSGMHFSQVKVSDLLLVNDSGEVVVGDRPVNAAAFANPAPYTFGDTPRTLAYRLRNTSGFNENFSIMRDIKLYESISLHVAFDAFNAFNRTQFSAPNPQTNITSTSFGEIGGQANTPRQFQGDVKIIF